jgi:hypothetical protein
LPAADRKSFPDCRPAIYEGTRAVEFPDAFFDLRAGFPGAILGYRLPAYRLAIEVMQ